MTIEELKDELKRVGFVKDIDGEYHFDIYTNRDYETKAEGRAVKLNLQVKLNYYNVGLVWWCRSNGKVSRMYYHDALVSFTSFDALVMDFLSHCKSRFAITPV